MRKLMALAVMGVLGATLVLVENARAEFLVQPPEPREIEVPKVPAGQFVEYSSRIGSKSVSFFAANGDLKVEAFYMDRGPVTCPDSRCVFTVVSVVTNLSKRPAMIDLMTLLVSKQYKLITPRMRMMFYGSYIHFYGDRDVSAEELQSQVLQPGEKLLMENSFLVYDRSVSTIVQDILALRISYILE